MSFCLSIPFCTIQKKSSTQHHVHWMYHAKFVIFTYKLLEAYRHVLELLLRLLNPNQSQGKFKHCWPELTRKESDMMLCCLTNEKRETIMNLKKILKPGQKHKLCPCIQQDQMDSHSQEDMACRLKGSRNMICSQGNLFSSHSFFFLHQFDSVF